MRYTGNVGARQIPIVQTNTAPSVDHVNKLAGLRREASNKLVHLNPQLRKLQIQANTTVLCRWALIVGLLCAYLFGIGNLYLKGNTVITVDLIAKKMPNTFDGINLTHTKLGDLTYVKYINMTTMAMKVLLDCERDSIYFIKLMNGVILWGGLISALLVFALYYLEFSLTQKLKRYRKKVTECETVLAMKGKRDDMIEKLLRFLEEDHANDDGDTPLI